jgi:hypothetical protein
MNRQPLPIFAVTLVLLGFGGCRPAGYEPSTQAEAQETYSRTKWCFARQLAFSKFVPELGEVATDSNRSQVFFQLASGTRINYTEFQPGRGIKAFHGLGRLESIPELAGPIYRMHNSYTGAHPEMVTLVGFCVDRMFQVTAGGQTNKLSCATQYHWLPTP